jgi:hypothetical protein
MKSLFMRAASGSIRQNLILQKKQLNYLRIVSLNELLNPFASSFSSSNKPRLNQTDLVNDNKLDNPDSLLKNFKHLEKDNKKQDPSQKPSLEQLLILKEKLISHVKNYFLYCI